MTISQGVLKPDFLQAGCPSHQPTNGGKALKVKGKMDHAQYGA